jgi:transcriptional regulator with XRE-family HTH domain
MKISNNLSDEVIMAEIGSRIARHRIRIGLTQAALAEQSGIGKRTLERIEAGESTQLPNMIRLLRALDLLKNLDTAIPEASTGPMDLLKRKGKERKRASTTNISEPSTKPWTWNDES